MTESNLNGIVLKYLDAKAFIKNNGFAEEIEWQDNLHIDNIEESTYLREAAWVILSSGMRESVIRKVFPLISASFYNWESSFIIISNQDFCFSSAMKDFANPKKLKAILRIAEIVHTEGFESVLQSIRQEKLAYITRLPFMGPATGYHFAKNIGLDVTKPDRHLIRIASNLGYNCPHKLCLDISEVTDEKLSVIDLVLWRYAVTDKNYLNFFSFD
ncbi:hypothetical protein WIW50_15085 [Flavobacteriaceae bacterium 3-367]